MEFTIVSSIAVGFLCFALILLLQLSKSPVRVSSNGARTPPGAWRIPLLGETLQFLRNPHHFYLDHIARFGDIFCTSLFGENCIVVTTPEASKWVLQTGQKLFKPGYPESANSLIDPTGSFSDQHHHSFVRRVVGSCLYPESLQHQVSYIDRMACSILEDWTAPEKSVNVYNEMAKYTFFVTMKISCGMEPGPEMNKMFKNMRDFEKAFLSLHINLPFTTYGRGLKARDSLFRAVESIIQQRRQDEEGIHSDMLESIVRSREDTSLTDIHVRGIIMTILFAGHETSAAQLVWAIKHLHDNPNLLQDVKAEHEAVLKSKGEPLTWAHLKEMHLTSRVINETMRTSYIGLFLPRQPLEDLEYNGYFFPKGWKVYASPSMLHLNPNLYPDPYIFDPSRFQDAGPKPNTFIPFGNGNRVCLGSELAKMQMLILIHHLVTKYSWKVQSSDPGIRWWPVPIPKDGLVIRVEDQCSQTRNHQAG